jgi:hypothetical protein
MHLLDWTGLDWIPPFKTNTCIHSFHTHQLLVVHLSLAAITAALLYTKIVKPNKQESSFAYLLGYGAIVPFWLVAPWYWIHLFGIRNNIIIFAAFLSVPTLVIFRTTAGMLCWTGVNLVVVVVCLFCLVCTYRIS